MLCVLLVSPKCLGGNCLGGKFLHRVNASAPASTWMVRYAISSTSCGVLRENGEAGDEIGLTGDSRRVEWWWS